MSIDNMLKHTVNRKDLRAVGLDYDSVGIKLEMQATKRVYFDKKGITVELEDGTYLGLKDLQRYIQKNKQTSHRSIFDTFTP
ncbi:hypothetical protein H8D36_04995 [archaeon]|nr:hypothetical protein [archaeon]MBL7056753.1 hypothetical protein [Candidatus Woesearchaeota archaeon]